MVRMIRIGAVHVRSTVAPPYTKCVEHLGLTARDGGADRTCRYANAGSIRVRRRQIRTVAWTATHLMLLDASHVSQLGARVVAESLVEMIDAEGGIPWSGAQRDGDYFLDLADR